MSTSDSTVAIIATPPVDYGRRHLVRDGDRDGMRPENVKNDGSGEK